MKNFILKWLGVEEALAAILKEKNQEIQDLREQFGALAKHNNVGIFRNPQDKYKAVPFQGGALQSSGVGGQTTLSR